MIIGLWLKLTGKQLDSQTSFLITLRNYNYNTVLLLYKRMLSVINSDFSLGLLNYIGKSSVDLREFIYAHTLNIQTCLLKPCFGSFC